MGSWKPRPSRDVHVQSMRLTAQEGYVLSRIDGTTDVDALAKLTGLSAEDLQPILDHLLVEGALEAPPVASPPREPVRTAPVLPAAAAENIEDLVGDAPEEPASPEGATHRELFERTLHSLPEDVRAQRALAAEEPELSAFCFDPVPAVIQRVLENPRAGLAQARLVAAHHRNPVGLEALAARVAFQRDPEVQRLLLRNIQTSDPLVRRLLSSRRLVEVYNASHSPELPERHRRTARDLLRSRFAAASPDERVELIVVTEGRVLQALSGLALDGRAVALLCARTFASALLVENLGRWPAAPPPLIAHLLKQPIARQAPPLRALLKRHPNCPQSAG
jgi:hypothetical protein